MGDSKLPLDVELAVDGVCVMGLRPVQGGQRGVSGWMDGWKLSWFKHDGSLVFAVL